MSGVISDILGQINDQVEDVAYEALPFVLDKMALDKANSKV